MAKDAMDSRFSYKYANLYNAAGPNLVQVTDAQEDPESNQVVSFADKVRKAAPSKDEGVQLVNVLLM